MKYAVLSMDVEDWYHLDYFDHAQCDTSYSMLDGLDVYSDLIARHNLPSSFFVLGEMAEKVKSRLTQLAAAGHDIGCHGWNHIRPLTMSRENFGSDLKKAKAVLEDIIGRVIPGYRAPCFSLDRARLEQVNEAGFVYDSSRILFGGHRLYGAIDVSGYLAVSRNIFRNHDFFEFQVSTLGIGGRDIPVAGGGYIRIFPWWLMRNLISRYLHDNELYVLYIHPFELSHRSAPKEPVGTSLATRARFRFGRSSVYRRLEALIALLRENGFAFTTFSALRNELLGEGQ